MFGVRVDPETYEPIEVPEEEHFMVCKHCGQAFDRRDLGQVLHHEEPEHDLLPLNS